MNTIRSIVCDLHNVPDGARVHVHAAMWQCQVRAQPVCVTVHLRQGAGGSIAWLHLCWSLSSSAYNNAQALGTVNVAIVQHGKSAVGIV